MMTSVGRPQTGSLLGVLVVALVAIFSFSASQPAQANPDDDVVRDLAIHYELDATGELYVTETFQWDFGDREGLGFYRTLVQRMGYLPDPSKERVLEYSNFKVSSPSGAPAEIWVESRTGPELRLAVGAPNGSSATRTGVQTYVLSYQVRGVVNAVRDQRGVADVDEFYFNVFSNSPNRVQNVTITVYGPADVVDVACYQGPEGSENPCDAYSSQGSQASFGAHEMSRREALTIMAGFPAGTFSDPGPILVDRPAGAATGDLVRYNWPIAAGGWAIVLALLGFVRVRLGRDRAFTDLPPGTLPPPDQLHHQQAALRSEPPIITRPVPPEGLRPAEAIVIAEEDTSAKALTATMIDLAVRGHYSIEPLPYDGQIGVDDWRLTRSPQAPPEQGLLGFERVLLNGLFANRGQVRISDLRETHYADLKAFTTELRAHSDSRGWFVGRGLVLGTKAAKIVIAVAIIMALLSGGLAFLVDSAAKTRHLTPIFVALTVGLFTGLAVWLATAKAAHGRSALGRAHYEQIRGFRDHLGSVEGHQVRWETGDDIFSDYLPWAVAFGLTARWVAIFEDLARQGQYPLMPVWYHGRDGDFATQISSIGESVGGGLQAALTYSPGSSGDSGSFSSGGGSSGGGVGGGSFGGR